MVSLTDEQVDFIRKEIESHGISLPDLQANLIDHMCTIIENQSVRPDFVHRKKVCKLCSIRLKTRTIK